MAFPIFQGSRLAAFPIFQDMHLLGDPHVEVKEKTDQGSGGLVDERLTRALYLFEIFP